MAQTLATRAYHAVNRVCLGKAKRVRFKSKGRGMDSVEGKRNDTGMRFLLQKPKGGWVLWGQDRIPALIDWNDPVVQHGLSQPIKYVRLIRRKASSAQAKGADSEGNRFFVQLVLKGKPYQKPKNQAGADTIGLDIGPSSLAVFSRQGRFSLRRSARSCNRMAGRSDDSSVKWSDSAGPTIRQLRRTRPRAQARQAPAQLEEQPELPGHPPPACQGGA